MGIAMLWIMLYHTGVVFNLKALDFIKNIGYSGVDIFLFASGIGNYFSYFKDESPADFLKRRIYRLAPIYIPFIIIWCAYNVLRNGMSPIYIIGNIFGIQDFSSGGISFNWYITALIICYLLTPYFASWVKRSSLIKNIALVAVLIMISVTFWGDEKFIVYFVRIPVYVIGMIFSKYCDIVLNKKYVFIEIVLFAFGAAILFLSRRYFKHLLWTYGLYWYPFIFTTPFLCCAFSWLSYKIEKYKPGKVVLSVIKKIGSISFELFLCHIWLFELVDDLINKYSLGHTNLIWASAFAAAFLLALFLNKAADLIKKLILKYSKRNKELKKGSL